MSTVKSPQEKKRNSLLKDRRNIYGGDAKASRKGIRTGKQRSHQGLRRAVSEELRSARGAGDEVLAELAEENAKDRMVDAKRRAFKKTPDAPLAVVIKRQRQKRKRRTVKGPWPKIDEIWQERRDENRLVRKLQKRV